MSRPNVDAFRVKNSPSGAGLSQKKHVSIEARFLLLRVDFFKLPVSSSLASCDFLRFFARYNFALLYNSLQESCHLAS